MIDSLSRSFHILYGVNKHQYNSLKMLLQFREFINFWFEVSADLGLKRRLID